ATVLIKVKNGKGAYVTPLEDMVIEFKSTLGDIIGTVQMASGAQSASTTIISGEMTGTAVVTASLGGLQGEGRIEFKGLPKRFCMHCGAAMTMEASSCPSCGLTPPSGVDTKQCPTCGTVIPEQAQFCNKCGAMQSVQAPPKVKELT
ncbi:MAG TPA: zinc ribbon domain-containing protein, partial [Methanocella sp.]